jgi:hypothetical protein
MENQQIKELSLQEMEGLMGGGSFDADCAGSIVASVGLTLGLIGLTGLSGGTLSPLMLGLWGAQKAVGIAAIVANCAD